MDGIRGDWVRRFYSDDKVIILKFIRIVFYRNLDGISGKKKFEESNIYSYSLYSRFKNTFSIFTKLYLFPAMRQTKQNPFFEKFHSLNLLEKRSKR